MISKGELQNGTIVKTDKFSVNAFVRLLCKTKILRVLEEDNVIILMPN
jgi:hypothetical protein